jgi:hypothetical protein
MKTRYFSLFEKIRIVYSNFFMVFGTIWTMFILLMLILANTDISNAIALNSSNSYTEGNIISKKETQRKGKVYYDRTIAYKVNNVCYTISERSQLDTITEKINVKYLPEKPEVSSVSENSVGEKVVILLVFSLFPLIGFVILAYGIKKSSQNLDVLENGEIALGKFLRSEATNTTINKQRVMKLYFSFTDKYGKEQQTVAETHNTHKLQDEALEMLVYMPDNVEKSVFLDILPSFVRERLEPEFVKLKSKTL